MQYLTQIIILNKYKSLASLLYFLLITKWLNALNSMVVKFICLLYSEISI